MPKVSTAFASSFLRGSDLTDPRDILILGWRNEYSYGKEDYVLDVVLDVNGEFAALRLTGTLARDIKAALGGVDEMDDWVHRIVTIYPAKQPIKDRTTGEEKIVDIIRAMAAEADKARKVPSLRSGGDDDDISF